MTVPAKPTMNFSFNSVITKESITDITSTLIVSILLASSTIIFTRANKIPLFEFNCYPNYLLEYYMRIVWPNILGLTSVVLIYYRNQKLLKAVKTKFQDYISNRHLKCCWFIVYKVYVLILFNLRIRFSIKLNNSSLLVTMKNKIVII